MGVILFKAHHSFGDGIGCSQFFLVLSEIFDSDALPTLKPISFMQKVVIALLSPWLIIKTAVEAL
jgi:hypothetical protein